jgi:uncharacterized protein YbbC (DUF1343 family)
MPRLSPLHEALAKAVETSKSPGAVACVGDVDTTHLHAAYGYRQLEPTRLPATVDTLYDLASLTKVIATTTAVLKLVEDGKIDLDRSVADYVPLPTFRSCTVRHCLTHTSGLHPGRPCYKDATSLDSMLQLYNARGLETAPGRYRRYSDVGYMALGKVVERVSGQPLDRFCKERIFDPLGMNTCRFRPPAEWRARCAATENCAWRGRVMVGQVHDENAYAVGGVAGHAGLFATAGDIATYCRAFMTGRVFKEETVATMTKLGQVPYWPWQGLGWELDPWGSRGHGYLPARTTMGHTGWTGTCLWMDPEQGLFAILLSNTCHPSRKQRDNTGLRGTFFKEVVRTFYPRCNTLHSGLDRLVRNGFDPLPGRRVALLTNHAAVDQLGRHIIDVFKLRPEVKLHVLYSPEHGIRGQAEAGQAVASENGPIPVISLYGDRKAPTQAELQEIDYFLVDLQDVGSRYYTYMATMKNCMAACAKARKPMFVLDRPNPVGGAVIEGPVAERTESPVCSAPIPARHGMTMGELALFFKKRFFSGVRLEVMVSALDNWERKQRYPQIGFPWIAPSPNMPTPTTALLYTGMCLFEGTNLNEGRGTDTPFEVCGAPWLDANAVIRAVPQSLQWGARLESATYTPRSIPGKSTNPRFKGKRCNGIRVIVMDPNRIRPFGLAIGLLCSMQAIHGRRIEFSDFFDTLMGSSSLRKAIVAGKSATAILDGFEEDLRRFNRERPRRYL